MEMTTEQLVLELTAEPDTRKQLALKSGFVSLQERLSLWTRPHLGGAGPSRSATQKDSQCRLAIWAEDQEEDQASKRKQFEQFEQFATLQEFFQAKSSLRKQLEQEQLERQARRPKLPIMKLTKNDWNVRCWEERSGGGGGNKTRRLSGDNSTKCIEDENQNSQPRVPASQPSGGSSARYQVGEIFNGRINEVARKLERVREGGPADEQLFRLQHCGNKLAGGGAKREHCWTDLLKNELSVGAHDPKKLRSLVNSNLGVKIVEKSPLGRPIKRLDCDDDD